MKNPSQKKAWSEPADAGGRKETRQRTKAGAKAGGKKSGKQMTKAEASGGAGDQRGTENVAQLWRAFEIFKICRRQEADPNPSKRYVTIPELMAKFERSWDTINRCMEMMRNDLDLPIEYIPERGGHGFTRKVTHFPLIMAGEAEMILLIVALQALAQFKASPVYRRLRRLLKRTFTTMDDNLGLNFAAIEGAVSFHHLGFDAPAAFDPELFEAATRAVINREEAELEHHSVTKPGKVKRVRIQPLHVAMVNQSLYLWVRDPAAAAGQDVRKYSLTRIKKFARTGKRFKGPAFDIEKELDDSLGAFTREPAQEVHLRFGARVAGMIAEKKWHRSQRLVTNADGTADLHLRAARTPDLMAFILRWAPDVEVLAPAELREEVWKIGAAMVARHGTASAGFPSAATSERG